MGRNPGEGMHGTTASTGSSLVQMLLGPGLPIPEHLFLRVGQHLPVSLVSCFRADVSFISNVVEVQGERKWLHWQQPLQGPEFSSAHASDEQLATISLWRPTSWQTEVIYMHSPCVVYKTHVGPSCACPDQQIDSRILCKAF